MDNHSFWDEIPYVNSFSDLIKKTTIAINDNKKDIVCKKNRQQSVGYA